MKRPIAIDHERREPVCIWVSAGVLNYRLCDRSFQCEGCDLFHALTAGDAHTFRSCDGPESRPGLAATHQVEPGGSTWTEDQVTTHLNHVLGDCPLYLDRYYKPPYFWLADEANGRVRLGLASHILHILSPIDEICTPNIGLHFRRDQPCGWITRNGTAISFAMPVSGLVSEVNGPSSARGDDGAGSENAWLLRIETDEPLSRAQDLIQGEETLLWYLDSIRTLKRHLREAVSETAANRIGPLMADGGALNPCLEEVLGPARFRRLLEQIA